jgi:hypothetical protein
MGITEAASTGGTRSQAENVGIGPGAIAQPSVVGGPGFCLSATEWIAIQQYVQYSLALPITDAQFRESLGPGAPSDLSDFTKLIDAYKKIFAHVTVWQDDTYPASVKLASDVVAYSKQVPVYYTPILPLADKLTIDPDDAVAKAKLAAILDQLSKEAKSYADKAAIVEKKVKTFSDETEADRVALLGVDGKGGLKKYYNDKYGATSDEVKKLNEELVAQTLVLNSANEEYKHDVVVAATTPTYAWIWPFGTVAAAVVAGIYGDKAVKALERGKAAQKKIDELNASLQMDAKLMEVINQASIGINDISLKLVAALPIIQKIQGVWGAMADDLAAIVTLIRDNIQEALPIIMSLGVDAAIVQWKSVGETANAYRLNAYITVQPHAGE